MQYSATHKTQNHQHQTTFLNDLNFVTRDQKRRRFDGINWNPEEQGLNKGMPHATTMKSWENRLKARKHESTKAQNNYVNTIPAGKGANKEKREFHQAPHEVCRQTIWWKTFKKYLIE